MNSVTEQLKITRTLLAMKQSELGKKLGLPQSHISKIEHGITDPRLSTLSDMARVMDQELMLIPRQLVPQVASILRGGNDEERKWQLDEGIET